MTSLFSSYNLYNYNYIEPTVMLISPKNRSPSSFWIIESVESRALTFFIYIGCWIFILYGLETYKLGQPISVKLGFSVGFLSLLLYDFLYNYATQLTVDSQQKKFTEMNTTSTNIVLDDKVFKLNKTRGLVIKKSVFDKLKKEKKLNTIPVQEYRDNAYIKSLGGIDGDEETPLAAYALSGRLVLGGSYLFFTVMTACIIASHHNRKILAAMLPFATISGVLAIAFISLWWMDRDYTSLITTEKMKVKIFITAFSFAFTAVTTPFFFV